MRIVFALIGILFFVNASAVERVLDFHSNIRIGPAGVRYVDKMAYDHRCTAAMLLGLGSRGFLKIRQLAGGYEVERTGKPVDWLVGKSGSDPDYKKTIATN